MNWKNRLWQFFLAIVVGATLSVCNSAMDTNNFEAIAGSISDGSDQGYMRIGNMQIAWASFTKTRGTAYSVTFPKAFLSEPTVSLGDTHNSGSNSDFFIVTNSLTKTGFSANSVGSGSSNVHYIAIGKWQ